MSYQMREEPISQMMASMESLDITSMRPDIKTVRDTHDTSLWLPGHMKPRTHTIVKKIKIIFTIIWPYIMLPLYRMGMGE